MVAFDGSNGHERIYVFNHFISILKNAFVTCN